MCADQSLSQERNPKFKEEDVEQGHRSSFAPARVRQAGSPDFGGLVLGCIRIRIRSRSVFEKKENLGVYRSQILEVNSEYSLESS